jgi:hypothetical protein
VDVNTLDVALGLALAHPINDDKSPTPKLETIHGREWICYDNSARETYGVTRETYGTLVDTTTVLLITGW